MAISQHDGARRRETPPVCESRVRRSGGFTLLELMIVVALIAIVAAVAIPSLTAARKSANEAAAISSLRNISTAQYHYRLRFLTYATVPDFVAAGSLDQSWADSIRSGYVFTCIVPPGGSTWSATADPLAPGATGDRYFFLDESGVIRFSAAGTAGSTDSPID